jgi:hypothetical protein
MGGVSGLRISLRYGDKMILLARSSNFDPRHQYSLDCAMAIVGWLMFGDVVQDEITANVLLTTSYPKSLSICIIVFIAVIPITKVPLRYVLSARTSPRCFRE